MPQHMLRHFYIVTFKYPNAAALYIIPSEITNTLAIPQKTVQTSPNIDT